MSGKTKNRQSKAVARERAKWLAGQAQREAHSANVAAKEEIRHQDAANLLELLTTGMVKKQLTNLEKAHAKAAELGIPAFQEMIYDEYGFMTYADARLSQAEIKKHTEDWIYQHHRHPTTEDVLVFSRYGAHSAAKMATYVRS